MHKLSPRQLLRLLPARVHEVAGSGKEVFAQVMAQPQPSVVWACVRYRGERLVPAAVAGMLAPERLLMIEAEDETALIWATEEALRSGAVGFVIAEPQKPLSLTAGRRLQLAAEAGGTTGLLLIREGIGSNAAETRWHCAPVWNGRDSTLQHWRLTKNKAGTLGEWFVSWDDKTRSVRVVSPPGE